MSLTIGGCSLIPNSVCLQSENPPESGCLELRETSFRRQLKADLNEINDLLNQTVLQDEMTQNFRTWHQQFTEAVSLSADTESIFNVFLPLLREMLTDPIFHKPLDEETNLGSDGFTYGKMAYALWKDAAPEKYKEFSPMDPKQKLTLTEHTVARQMIRWLNKHEPFHPPKEMERNYQELNIRQAQEKILRRNEKKKSLAQEKIKAKVETQEKIEEFCKGVAAPFQQLRKRMDNDSEKILSKIESIKANDEKSREDLMKAVEKLGSEIQDIEEQNDKLREKIESVNEKISEAENANIKLQVAINQTRAAIKKQKMGWLKTAAIAIAIIGACTVATLAIAAALEAAELSAAVAVLPMNEGANLSITILF